jgi:hypothetical protein
MPAYVLSEITLRSNYAIAPTIENAMRPAAVLVSIPSIIELKADRVDRRFAASEVLTPRGDQSARP